MGKAQRFSRRPCRICSCAVTPDSDVNYAGAAGSLYNEVFLESPLRNLPSPRYMVPAAAVPLHRMPLSNRSQPDRQGHQRPI